MSLKINRGHGAPTELLKEGEPYLDLDSGNIYLGDGSENQKFVKTGFNKVIPTLIDATIPAISAGQRIQTQINLGILRNKKQVIINFWDDTTTQEDAENYLGSKILAVSFGQGLFFNFPILDFGQPIKHLGCSAFLLVDEDYNKTTREIVPSDIMMGDGDGGTDKLINAYAYDYAHIGFLAGLYASTKAGFLRNIWVEKYSQKIIFEAAWLNQNGENTILNLSLENIDTTDAPAVSFKIGVWE